MRHAQLIAAFITTAGLASSVFAQACDVVNPIVVPHPITVTRTVQFTTPSSPTPPVITLSQAFAYATAIGMLNCYVNIQAMGLNGAFNQYTYDVGIVASGGEGDVDTVFGPGAMASASAPPGVPVEGWRYVYTPGFPPSQGPHIRDFYGYIANANVSVSAGGTLPDAIATIWMQATAGPEVIVALHHHSTPTDDVYYWGFGGAAAITSGYVEFEFPASTTLTVTDTVGANWPIPGMGTRTFSLSVVSDGTSASAGPIVVSAPSGVVAPGSTDNGDGTYTRATNLPVSAGVVGLTITSIDGTDAGLDADCDGRFTADDVAVVVGWIGTDISTLGPAEECPRNPDGTPNGGADRFDLDDDGFITAGDVDLMAAALDGLTAIGQQAGIFGDVDRDGDLDCDDLVASVGVWNTVLTDPDYTPALDADLDGDVDASDQDAFYALEPFRTDVNRDGAINSNDISAFLTVWSTMDPAADFDGNGVVNSADISAFLAAWEVVAGCN